MPTINKSNCSEDHFCSLYSHFPTLKSTQLCEKSVCSCLITIISISQGTFEYKPQPPKFVSKVKGEKKHTQNKVLPNTRRKFGSVTAYEQNMTDVRQTQRKMSLCCNRGKWKHSVNLFRKSLNQSEQHMWHNFSKMNSAADSKQLIQF